MYRSTPHKATRLDSASKTSPVLLNELYSSLIASSNAYHQCSSRLSLQLINLWINSYAERLENMGQQLKEEGATHLKEINLIAQDLLFNQALDSPKSFLILAENNQQELIKRIALLTDRLDMDAELYGLLVDQHSELKESLHDMQDLRREYETYY